MTKEDIRQLIRDELSIECHEVRRGYDQWGIDIILKLKQETIGTMVYIYSVEEWDCGRSGGSVMVGVQLKCY